MQSGVRQPGQLARRRRQHPDRTLRRRRRRHVPAGRGVVGDRAAASRAWRTAPPSSAAGAPACAAPRRCSDRCRCRAWPRRSRHRARGRSRRSSPSRATRCCPRPAGHKLDEVLPTLDAMICGRPVAQRDHPARRRHPARAVAAGAAAPRRPDPQLRDQQHRQLLRAGVRPGRPGPPAGMGDPDPADRAVHRHARRGSSTSRRSTTASSTTWRSPRDLDGAQIRKHYDHGGPERILDLTLAHRPVRRPLWREPRRPDAGEAEGPAQRHQLRADGAAGAARSSARRTARSGWRRSTCSTTCRALPRA